MPRSVSLSGELCREEAVEADPCCSLSRPPSRAVSYVHKVPLHIGSRNHVRHDFESLYLSVHCGATFLAREFMKVKPASYPTLRFVDVSLVYYVNRARCPYPFCTEEEFLEGVYEKYNNNHGGVIPSPAAGLKARTLQAFSHWSYVVTGGKMMVVDLQGVYSPTEDGFILTDPAIHTLDLTRFGHTNLGQEGFKLFFQTHECTKCCRDLGLPPPPDEV